MNDQQQGIDPRKLEKLYSAFENADFIVRKRFRADLDKYPVCDLPEWLSRTIPTGKSDDSQSDNSDFRVNELGDNVQFVKIENLVYDKNESIADKLTTVYHTMSAFANTGVIMLLNSNGISTDIYLGVAERMSADERINVNRRGNKMQTLKTAFEANFPGSTVAEMVDKRPIDKKKVIDTLCRDIQSVSCVTGIGSLRSKETGENVKFIQGLEKLVDSMRGNRFSAVFIADCKGTSEIEDLCSKYEDIYSQISPFAQSQQTIGTSTANTESFIDGVTDTTNESVSDTVSHSRTIGKFSSDSIGGSVTAGGKVGIPFVAKGSASVSVNYNHSGGHNESDGESESRAKTTGTSKSLTKQNSVAKSIGVSDGLQINFQNRAVKTLMDRIDEQIKHLRACEAYGVFDFSCYFLAEESAISMAAASVYDSLMRGEESGAEVSSVSTWTDDNAIKALEYLKRFYHPLIAIPNLSKPQLNENDAKTGLYDILPVTPSAIISGKEIALHMGLPRKSVPGIPVTECAEFGRNVISRDTSIDGNTRLGCIYHMQKEEEKVPVKLDAKSLTAHTFITGSTGSGKSNTIYTMLNELCFRHKEKTHFLVIEPAKGEYKRVFGGRSDVSVYGTNFKMAPLLRLNPFSFPDEIHVLEHIDRLIEVFNACWPMYAAMPAVLKDAVEESYKSCGWNLTLSECAGKTKTYPTFETLLQKLPEIMDSSAYSKDTKGDYTGALVTRVKSLTNGINGQIFCSEHEISHKNLFDKNVIVDLSRVGSAETKSLLMGILMIKLQEYRMAMAEKTGETNSDLQHITVLEEAHNLLRRTSSEQSQDSSNLQGKSVEMLANAIAEMRTYGEGFIIADQAPGLLDMAVIRNTNTKIIMRLPDESDRVLVGKAAGLTDEQIKELSKLDCGVAAVFQNHWLEAVLCKVDYFEDKKPYNHKEAETILKTGAPRMNFLFETILGRPRTAELTDEDVDRVKTWIDESKIPAGAKQRLHDVLDGKCDLNEKSRRELLYHIVNGNTFLKQAGMYAGSGSAREAGMREIDRELMEMLEVSAVLAEEIRKQIFLLAADHIDKMPQHNELLYYGGVR